MWQFTPKNMVTQSAAGEGKFEYEILWETWFHIASRICG